MPVIAIGRVVIVVIVIVIARLHGNRKNRYREDAKIEAKLAEMFDPRDKRCYQRLSVLPALDQLQLEREKTTLVILKPDTDFQKFFAGQKLLSPEISNAASPAVGCKPSQSYRRKQGKAAKTALNNATYSI